MTTLTGIETEALKIEKERLRYQKYQCLATWAGVFVAGASLIFLAMQFENFSNQTKIQTDAIAIQTEATRIQSKALEAQTHAANAQIWQGIAHEQIALSKMSVDYPQIRPYFEKRKELKDTDPKYDLVMSVAEMKLDFIDSFDDPHTKYLAGMKECPKDKETDDCRYRALWDKYFIHSFKSSPALCMAYDELQEFYTQSVKKYAVLGGCKLSQAPGPKAR